MADHVIAARIDLDAGNSSKTVKEFRQELDQAKQSVVELEKQFGSNSEEVIQAKKRVDELSGALKTAEDAGKKGSKAMGTLGTALKGLGIISALVAIFEYFKEVLGKNQTVANGFATVMKALDIVFNDLINLIMNNAPKVVQFFKDIFENPGKYVTQLGEAIKANLIERVNSFIKTLGYLGDVISKVFKGDFKGAIESGKKAGVEFVDIMTGVDNSLNRASAAVANVASAMGDYAGKTLDAANAQIQLENRAKLAQIQLEGLVEKYDREAELQRQIRDNESLTFEERIKANNELGKILEKQEAAQLKLAAVEVQRAKTELDRNRQSIDLQVQYQAALNQQAAISAQVTGLRSEQMVNEIALEKERLAVYQENQAKIMEIDSLIQANKDETEQKEKDRFDRMIQNSLDASAKEIENLSATQKAREEIADAENAMQQEKLNTMSSIAGKASKIAGEQTLIGKGMAIAQAGMDTYAAANDALKANYGPFGPFALAAKIAAVATTIGMGLKNIQQIAKIQVPGVGGGSSPSISAGAPAPLQPQLVQTSTTLPQDQLNQIGNAAAGGAGRSYVITADLNDQQDVNARLERAAKLG